MQRAGLLHLGTARGPRDCWIENRKSEGEILWPAAELAALSIGYAFGVCRTRMDEIKSEPKVDLEGLCAS